MRGTEVEHTDVVQNFNYGNKSFVIITEKDLLQ